VINPNPKPVGPPILVQPPTEPPVSQPPSSNGVQIGAPEVDINFNFNSGGASASGAVAGSALEVVINFGQSSFGQSSG
jgi:hypothetical protein